MEEERITLDREAFRALASDTRVSILKSLGRRRKTLTELSKQLGMSPSSVKEHMESLTGAGLTVMIDDGHKWKYYELTRKGRNVLNPSDTKIWILLSVSVLGILVASLDLLKNAIQPAYMAIPEPLDMVRAPVSGGAETLAENAPAAASAIHIPYLHIAAIALFSCVAALALYSLYKKKRTLFKSQ